VAPLKGSDIRLRGSRVAEACRVAEIIEDAVRSDRFPISRGRLMDLLCQHAAQTGDYRNPEFDVLGAVATIRKIFRVLKGMMAPAWQACADWLGIRTDEGAVEAPLRAFSPYGLSKGLPGNITASERKI